MMVFIFEPLIGPLPLRFGMSPEEVAAVVGVPERMLPDAFGNRTESRRGYSVGYDATSGRLNEVVFSKGELFFHGVDLFCVTDVVDFLRKYDANPQVAVGMIFFVKLGLRLSGFHDGGEQQQAIGLTTMGHWDEFADDFIPLK
jgi:hypothetical protein